MKLSDAQLIEAFHLAFLQVLQARVQQEHYVLKGGANLRYFFDSVRYSEDIDLDAIRSRRGSSKKESTTCSARLPWKSCCAPSAWH